MAEETKAEKAVTIQVQFLPTEAAWLNGKAAEKGLPVNVVVRQAVAAAMEAEVKALLVPVGAAAAAVTAPSMVPQYGTPAGGAKLGEVQPNGLIHSPEMLLAVDWLQNQTHHAGARELAEIFFHYVRGKGIPTKGPELISSFRERKE